MACGAAAFESALEQEITFCLADSFHWRRIIDKKVALLSYENNATVLELDDVPH